LLSTLVAKPAKKPCTVLGLVESSILFLAGAVLEASTFFTTFFFVLVDFGEGSEAFSFTGTTPAFFSKFFFSL
jgi:hypothetical protein